MWGVSPAYFISRYSTDFLPEDISASAEDIATLGFDAFEAEIFYPDRLDDWSSNTSKAILQAAKQAGLTISCFAAHFLLYAFATSDTVSSDYGIAEFDRVCDIASELETDCVIVPLPAFLSERDEFCLLSTLKKLEAMTLIAARKKTKLALELMPESLVSDMDSINRLFMDIDDTHLGLNLDSGHFNAMGIPPHLIANTFAERIFATHLCDNNASENLSLAPTEGNIDWQTLMSSLISTGCKASFDIEIVCNPHETEEKYKKALSFLSNKEYKE